MTQGLYFSRRNPYLVSMRVLAMLLLGVVAMGCAGRVIDEPTPPAPVETPDPEPAAVQPEPAPVEVTPTPEGCEWVAPEPEECESGAVLVCATGTPPAYCSSLKSKRGELPRWCCE